MTDPVPGLRPPRPGRRWAGLALVLTVAAGGLAAGLAAYRQPEPVAAAAPARPDPTATTPRATRSVPPAEPLSGAPPVALRVPSIGLAVPLTRLGLNPDRTVEVPTDFRQAGWFRYGPTPGRVGSAVVLGHVDSYRGPAVFFRLRELRAGDRVEVTLADGAVARFAVRTVETHLKTAFPARRVYGSHGDRALNLVTCGGEFDRGARSYRSNVVAYTRLVSVTPAPAGRTETVRPRS